MYESGTYVALDGHTNAAPDDTIAVTAAQGCLHARDTLVRHALEEADVKAEPVNETIVDSQ